MAKGQTKNTNYFQQSIKL